MKKINTSIQRSEQRALKRKIVRKMQRKGRTRGMERDNLILSAQKATADAIRISKALDLPISRIEQGVFVRELPDGRIIKMGTIEKTVSNKGPLSKGTTLCLK